MNPPMNSKLQSKLIELYEKGADSVLIDWKRDDVKPLIDEIISMYYEGKINELKDLKNYMISTSPFINEILEPRIEQLENKLSSLRGDSHGK